MSQGARIGSISIINVREDETVNVNITSNPVESGAPITDHVQQQNRTLRISGYLLGNLAESRFRQLERISRSGTITSYRGRIQLSDVLISSISRGYQDIRNGMEINITLTTVRRARTSWVRRTTSTGKQQPTPSRTTTKHVTVRAGNTYWGWSQKYGSTIAQLRSWNGWPDRFIPIGARARVR